MGGLSCNNVAPVTNLCLGRATTRSHSSQWSKIKVAVTIGKHSRLNRQIWYRHPNSEAGDDEIQNVNMDFYFVGITF
jgi:hypothetical protein